MMAFGGAAETTSVISLDLIDRSNPNREMALGGLLAIPIVPLIGVAGLCVASGLPLPRN
jgi:hypothetical protein